jgi:hypothetical protein
MRRNPVVPAWAALAASPVLVLSLLSQNPSTPPATPYVYQGTVQALQPSTGSLSIITGVGFALRLIHIRTVPETQIISNQVTVAFSAIAVGDIVRAECRMMDTVLVADRIEKLTAVGAAPETQP